MILKPTQENIEAAARAITGGDLVAFPTETVYGLGADAMNPTAVAKIFEAKRRPFFDPLIVHVPEPSWLERLAADIPAGAHALIDRFWPGPLTIVFLKKKDVPDIVTAGLATVAVRMPSHPAAREMIRLADTPVAAPSANPFGYLSPTTAEHVRRQLAGAVDIIIDGGPCPVGVESTIIRIEPDRTLILRHGGVTAEEIAAIAGPVESAPDSATPDAPGRLPSHYAPRTPVTLVRSPGDAPGGNTGLLTLAPPDIPAKCRLVTVLSPRGDLREAAARLFEALHDMDGAGLDRIYAVEMPERGLGAAIMDRLRRAAGKSGA
jgi:L-threonylcarbamoyladenylate synthase